jgi:LPS sulfotransferase NodH
MLEGITRSFTIAFTVRSGSNAICDLLGRNGLGVPGEWFQSLPAANGKEPWLEAFARTISQHQAQGVFGSKMSHNHRAALDECLREALPGYRVLDNVLPFHRWVRLVRKDKILQAISFCRAESSGQWVRPVADQVPSPDFNYDFFHILSRLIMIQCGELAWEIYFQQHHITPLIIVYEDFFRDIEGQLSQLIHYLGGLPSGRASLDTDQRFEIQRDDLNNTLRQKFISDFTRIGEASLVKEIGEPLDRWNRFFFEYQWRCAM